MKRFACFLCIMFVACYLYAQDNSALKDGYQIFKYPNGAVSSEGLIKDGKPEGFWKSYYVTGIKKSEGRRTNFQLDSIWLFYDQAGDTLEKISYKAGKKNGWYIKYKKEAQKGLYIVSRELFAGDKKEGTAYFYYPEGTVQQTIGYNEGKKVGLSKEFDKEGNILTLLEYNNDFLVSREKINRKDQKGLKQGDWKEFYPSGVIKNEKTFINDLLSGYYKEYDQRGRLTLTMLYEKGAIVKSKVEDEQDIKIVNKYDPNGKLIYSGPYKDSVRVGIHREYSPEGKIIRALLYNDNGLKVSEGLVDEAGNRNGKWKDFYADGKINAEGQYTDNKKSGIWKYYNSEQKLVQTGGYSGGRPDGLWKWYYESGSVLREEEYFQGKRDGQFTEYSLSGAIIAQGLYSDGEKNGEWITNVGECIEEGKYIAGLKEGIWKTSYTNGKLKFKGNYTQGNPDGTQEFYYDNGNVKEEQYYSMGIRQRSWKKFNEEGMPVIVITYKDDTETSINGIKIKLPQSEVRLIK